MCSNCFGHRIISNLFTELLVNGYKKKWTYNEITTYISNENYGAALDILENLDYKDSDKMISFCNDIKNDKII
jgi:hypothetical protein